MMLRRRKMDGRSSTRMFSVFHHWRHSSAPYLVCASRLWCYCYCRVECRCSCDQRYTQVRPRLLATLYTPNYIGLMYQSGSRSSSVSWCLTICRTKHSSTLSTSASLSPVSPLDNMFAVPAEVFLSCLAIISAVMVRWLFLWPALWYGTGYQTVWEIRPSADTFMHSLKTFLFSSYSCT